MGTTIKLELLDTEVNSILLTLARAPYDQVAALIKKIEAQAIPQLGKEAANK